MDAGANQPPIGIIAGQGRLPVMIAEGIRASGRRVACVGLAGFYDADLPGRCDHFDTAGFIRIGRWIRLMRRWGVHEAVMVGRVEKKRMYAPMLMFRQMPDWRAAKLWYRVLRHDRRPASVLGAVANELKSEGIELIDTTKYIPQYLADEGVMTRCQPSASQLADVAFGWPLVRQLNQLDIGQALAVKSCETIAVEAIEGTNAMIRRAGDLCRSGGWTLLKTAKREHDMRLDVPVVGPATLAAMHDARCTCLVLEAGKVIMAEKPEFLALAEKLKIVVMGKVGE